MLRKRIIAFVLMLVLFVTMMPFNFALVSSAATLPTDVYLAQEKNDTCTLSSATMMLRARMYLSGNSQWSSITESTIRSTAWTSEGLKWSWTYSINGNRMSVSHAFTSGISVSTLKGLLDQHAEGIVLYCGYKPHAVFLTDYQGDTFYCADPAGSYARTRRTLASSSLGAYYGSQSNVLSNVTAYWYVSSYSITDNGGGSSGGGTVTNNRPGKISWYWLADHYYIGETVTFKWKASDNTTHYNLWICKEDPNGTYVDSDGTWRWYMYTKEVSTGVSYTFEEGRYRAAIFSYNSNAWEADGSDWLHTQSDFVYFDVSGEHTCDKGEFVYFQKSHPHPNCYRCSICGEIWTDTSSSLYYDLCLECKRPGKSTLSEVKSQYTTDDAVTFTWSTTSNTTHYNLAIYKKDLEGTFKDEYGTYVMLNYNHFVESGVKYTFDKGEYRILVISYNSDEWEEDESDWLHSYSNYIYFSVVPSDPCTRQHDYSTKVIEPTCTEKGYTLYTCSRCGDRYTRVEKDALGHAWDDGKVTTEPTEGSTGVRTYNCTRCGETKTESIPPKDHIHDYTVVITDPTCTEAGYTTHTCTCGESYTDTYTDALKHSYTDGLCVRCDAVDPDYEKPGHICPSVGFSDVPAYGNWAHDGIDYCVEHELMNGIGNGLFDPNGTVSRAQLVTILYRVAGSPQIEFKGTFTDVPDGKWYSKAIEWAAANGVVNGIGGGKFSPDQSITREQIATILYRYENQPAVSGSLDSFPDKGNVSGFAVNAMLWATSEKLINGVSSGGVTTLAPKSNATRAQIAAIIMRYLEA